MKECKKCGGSLVKLPQKNLGFLQFTGAYFASELLLWTTVGLVLSIGLAGNPVAFTIGLVVATLVFVGITTQERVYKCVDCKRRYKGKDENDLGKTE